MGRVFARFLVALQVQAARIRSLQASRSPSPSLKVFCSLAELEDRAFDAAALYARAAALFEFARGVSETAPADYEPGQMKVGLHLMGFYDYDQPQLYERIDGRSNYLI